MPPRAVAELLPHALRANVAALARHAGARVLLPVKANAYGHGLDAVVAATRDLPELWGYGVATPAEAVRVAARSEGRPVLLLTPADPDEARELVALGVRLAVTSREAADVLPAGARVHLKVNTGMNRLGVRPHEVPELAARLRAEGRLEGLYTHFASADAEDVGEAEAALAVFAGIARGVPGVLAHASNSGGVLSFGRRGAFDLVRPGIAAYGFPPEPHLAGVLPLAPALRLRARVTHVHVVPAGETVSYGGLWRAERDTTVATLAIGYADGFPRRATGAASVLVRGEARPVLGRICMDQCMIDVTHLDVRPGELLEVFGDGAITAQQVADQAGTNVYEVLVGIGERVERRTAPVAESVG